MKTKKILSASGSTLDNINQEDIDNREDERLQARGWRKSYLDDCRRRMVCSVCGCKIRGRVACGVAASGGPPLCGGHRAVAYGFKVEEGVLSGNREMDRWYNLDRLRVIYYYGGKCACCGEGHYEFLHIDHIHGNGAAHRRELEKMGVTYIATWIIENNFPKDFRVLCANCNLAIGFYGRCPHSLEKNGVVMRINPFQEALNSKKEKQYYWLLHVVL
jgi:hypothetical protein